MLFLIMFVVLTSSVLTYTSFKLINDKLDEMQKFEILNMKGDDGYDF